MRVLQEHTVRRIGGSREIPINVRIISATNRNLEEMVQNDMFRQDLYYRLNVIPLYLPPLRERREDIALLANYLFNSTVADINPNVKSISPEAIKKLESYDYPGNVRELSNIIERAINMARKPVITPNDIIFSIQNQSINTNNPNNNIIDFNLNAAVKNTEKRIIREALKEFNSSRKLGAALGISHTSIIRKMKEYNLHFKE